MSKDGTNRGGSRPGAGRKPKAIAEKLATGNPGGRPLTVVDFGDEDAPGQGLPKSKAKGRHRHLRRGDLQGDLGVVAGTQV